MKTKSKRLANIELLRIIAMLMVVMLHYLGKGELLPTVQVGMSGMGYVAWILESLSIVAVNVYVLISGYFLVESEFKLEKIVRLVLQVLFYTIIITVLAFAFGLIGKEELGIYNLVVQLFPFQMEQYWFMTSYLILYILSPILAQGVKALSKKQLQVVIVVFVLFMCVEKSLLPVQIVFDKKGYDALWFVCLFLIAAYIRLHGIKMLKKPFWGAILYFGGCILLFVENLLLSVIYEKTGELGHLINSPYHYNHIFTLLAAVGIFTFFLGISLKEGKITSVICKIAPYTLGVYLLHEHVYVRYLWPQWLGAGRIDNVGTFIVFALLAVITVFVVGVVVDYLRSLLYKAGSKLIHGKKA